MAVDNPAATNAPAKAASNGRWYALVLLTALYTLNSIDRQLTSVGGEALKRQFHLSDSQLGVLTGLAYAVPFCLAGVPVGLLIDRVSRSKLIAGLLAVWSGLTFFSGLAGSFGQLVLARAGVAAAEAGASPTCMSLITDLFPKEKRSSALAWFYFSTPLGIAIGFAMGGLVLAHWGWRAAFFVAGVPGFVLSLVLLLTLKEPKRGAFEAAPIRRRSSPGELVRLFSQRKALVYLLLAAVVQTAAQSGVGAFLAPFFIRVHHVAPGQAGIFVALALGGGAALGLPLGGVVGDLLSKTSPSVALAFVGVAMLAAGPCAMMAFAADAPMRIALWAGVYSILLATYYGPTFSNFLSIAPASMRGAVGAVMMALNSLVGYGLGPPLVGVLSDLLHRQGWPDPLRWALTVVVGLYVLAGLFFFLAARTVGRDLSHQD